LAKFVGCPRRAALVATCRQVGRTRIRAVATTGAAFGLAAASTIRLLTGPHCRATGPLIVASAVILVSALATLLRTAEPWMADGSSQPQDLPMTLHLVGSQASFALGGAAAAQLLFDLAGAFQGVQGVHDSAADIAACLASSFLGLHLAERAADREADILRSGYDARERGVA
jgi:hypothetical protein